MEFTTRNRGGLAVDQKLVRDAQGAITNRQIKRVCQPCNNVWMGRQEENAKAVVTDLIQANPVMLTDSNRTPLVRWLVIKLMVLDVLRDGEQAFTVEERRDFRTDWALPENLAIWVMRCGDSDWKTLFWSNAQRLTLHGGDTPKGATPPSLAGPNVKLFLWGVGEALIVALYQREIQFPLGMQDEFALRLLPNPGLAQAWPPTPVTGDQARRLTRTLQDLPTTFGFHAIELDDPRES